MTNIINLARQAKKGSARLLELSTQEKNAALLQLAEILDKNKVEILRANAKDINKAKTENFDDTFIDRLTFTEQRVKAMAEAVREIATLKDSVAEVIEKRILGNDVLPAPSGAGLFVRLLWPAILHPSQGWSIRRQQNRAILKKIRVPLGVVFVIYESRPNVTIETISLCLKSSNAVILKGGSEAQKTNAVLVKLAKEVLKNFCVDEAIQFIETADRRIIKKLLKLDQYIDVVIPRGGYKLVKTILKNSTIPVLAHSEGINHIYIDKKTDLKVAEKVCLNAKINRPGTCNALDVLLVHKDITKHFLKSFAQRLKKAGVEIRGDSKTRKIIQVKKATSQDWKTEFLSLVLAIKVVESLDEAIEFINHYGSRHSEGIVSKDKKAVKKFINKVDSAAIFVNCSTRLHDGGIFGMGAEMGIATGKLHARGPVGLKELTTYKWVLKGNGQVRT